MYINIRVWTISQGLFMSEIPVKGTWVQTERKAHEAWALLIGSKPKAAQLMHLLVANMDRRGAVVVSQKVLTEMMGCSLNTVKRSLKALKDDNWLEVARIGSERGGVNAYMINRRVAWADKRDNQRFAAFDARIILSASEQDQDTLDAREPLRQLPQMGESQLPTGVGLEPPSQPSLEGMEPDLPATVRDDEGNVYEVNQETGEMLLARG
jgi:DNA-binding transcriptional regulator YhcF (GntR family)